MYHTFLPLLLLGALPMCFVPRSYALVGLPFAAVGFLLALNGSAEAPIHLGGVRSGMVSNFRRVDSHSSAPQEAEAGSNIKRTRRVSAKGAVSGTLCFESMPHAENQCIVKERRASED